MACLQYKLKVHEEVMFDGPRFLHANVKVNKNSVYIKMKSDVWRLSKFIDICCNTISCVKTFRNDKSVLCIVVLFYKKYSRYKINKN